ncbi:class I SAM-dependent methyltransferase [Paracoccus sp. DMF-8]|uniref:class I SAM-dependent methyltransferase n=1 Tax=Paracoccus sp. DMF-8 TaxID=3019445 RepID=UPI0023E361D9|nr:class I SAM-dependent methyltransferase [Paracoccus sp. DMF-8]MDF3607323.1 class I SAM-dependent methyltransferase [Paracoccus sp. DMF-8]
MTSSPAFSSTAFSGAAATRYADAPPRQVPGFHDLHRMIRLLLAETLPPDARLLILGAGGGLEMKSLAEAQPGWHFDGVDPSADMLQIARQTVGPLAGRMGFHQGYVQDAPAGPFDAATALLTFHFIPLAQRVATLRQLHRRLKPGAPLVLVHISFPQDEPARSQWIARHVAFGAADDADPARLEQSRQAIAARLTILPPEQEEAHLRAAGFRDVSLFYAAFSLRGWIACAD